MSTHTYSISNVQSEYNLARRRAVVRTVVTAVTHTPNRLHSLGEVDGKFIMDAEHYLGIRQVEVRKVVGSIARYQDFDGKFNPLHNNSRARWERVASALLNDVILPPVELLKIGDYYLVKDGNHRVSVARHYGVQYIDAEVTEYVTPCSLAGTREQQAMTALVAGLTSQARERLGNTLTTLGTLMHRRKPETRCEEVCA